VSELAKNPWMATIGTLESLHAPIGGKCISLGSTMMVLEIGTAESIPVVQESESQIIEFSSSVDFTVKMAL
jgi:hypothetical protein